MSKPWGIAAQLHSEGGQVGVVGKAGRGGCVVKLRMKGYKERSSRMFRYTRSLGS